MTPILGISLELTLFLSLSPSNIPSLFQVDSGASTSSDSPRVETTFAPSKPITLVNNNYAHIEQQRRYDSLRKPFPYFYRNPLFSEDKQDWFLCRRRGVPAGPALVRRGCATAPEQADAGIRAGLGHPTQCREHPSQSVGLPAPRGERDGPGWTVLGQLWERDGHGQCGQPVREL